MTYTGCFNIIWKKKNIQYNIITKPNMQKDTSEKQRVIIAPLCIKRVTERVSTLLKGTVRPKKKKLYYSFDSDENLHTCKKSGTK